MPSHETLPQEAYLLGSSPTATTQVSPAVLLAGVRGLQVSHVRLHVHPVRGHDLLLPDVPGVQRRILSELEPQTDRRLLPHSHHSTENVFASKLLPS